jgi:uncharacterized protein YoxC
MENTQVRRFYSFNTFNLGMALLTLFILALGALIAQAIFEFDSYNFLLMITLLLVAYSVILLGLALTRTVKVIKQLKSQVRIVEKPVERIVEKIVEKPVIRYIDRPGKTRTITRIVNRVRTVKQRVKKLNIPQFKFIGSSVTKRFHTHACRLGKLVKRKYKIHNNSKAFFIKRRFKPCKVCILKTKKI